MSDSIKSIIVTSGAMFALFFGAGNLILPPQLGAYFPMSWPWTALGFCITAIVFPVLGIAAHARNQGGIHGLASPMGRWFAWIFPVLIYLIAILLPSPRTASVTYEVGIRPLWAVQPAAFSFFYFSGVLLVGWFRSRLLDLMGKYLNPLLLLSVIAIIAGALLLPDGGGQDRADPAFIYGIIEGYQTYDALAALVIGGVVIVSFKGAYPNWDSLRLQRVVMISGGVAGLCLLLVYGGLIYGGSQLPFSSFELGRTALLKELSLRSLGGASVYILGILVSLACFSTACGISIGAADFAAEWIGRRPQFHYRLTLVAVCLLGWLVGMWEADTIVRWGYPVLLLTYPAIILLILLSLLPAERLGRVWFRATLWVSIAMSVPDAATYLWPVLKESALLNLIPGSQWQMGWVLPSFAVLVAGLFFNRAQRTSAAGH